MTRIDDKILLRRYHEDGDLQAREQLIEQYMSLVRSLARRYSYRGEQLEDLVQIGAIGLIKAIDRFDVQRGVELPVLVGAASGERERGVGAPGLERLQHQLLLDPGGFRELRDRRRALELDGELLDQPRELDVQLLEPARDAHRPAAVAEVPLDLTDDVRRRVSRQLHPALDVEPVDRLDQADRADLDQVVELLAAVGVAPRERPDE